VGLPFTLVIGLGFVLAACVQSDAGRSPDVAGSNAAPPSQQISAHRLPVGGLPSQRNALANTIRPCWNFDPRTAEKVTVRVFLKPDGTVVRAEPDDLTIIDHSPQHKAALLTAYRALMNPQCNKLPITAERETSLVITFDPKDMGQ
jgi:hypothetical protein